MSEQELRCLVIGVAGGRLIAPGSLVIEVLPYAQPLRVQNAPGWVLGSLLWRARTIPLLGVEPLLLGRETEPGVRSRIVVLKTPSERVEYLGFVAQEVPQLTLVTREHLRADDDTPCPQGMLRAVLWQGGRTYIPDFDWFCTELAALGIYRS
ncbi:chemotaxis protein CheW [Plasticicumulans acidivorans]|uniref:Chemosensory pili system protein ChpC n=1 Tax=Plasticicumulans acidivorans TaxID=886464 RepID=A0A317MWZ1_9GAMM|nr:chemotaxis protein CheW [Plasticicumulans acidivorans]PWV62328.1 chemosensory pili system protein ChpC [Plasticicumulans acidivorans]